MKYVIVVLVVAVLCLVGLGPSWASRSPVPVAPATAALASVKPSQVAQKAPAVVSPSVAVSATSVPPPEKKALSLPIAVAVEPAPAERPARPAWETQSGLTEPTRPPGAPRPLPPIVLSEVLGPNNLYHDDAMGIAATYPEGWTVPIARRWGANNSENTVSLVPNYTTSARPSMYYQLYPNGYPELEGTEAYFRRVAQNKENQRVASGAADYKNLPGTMDLTEINGNPAMSYVGVFGQGDNVQTEFFVRILGKKGYVMFFVPGRMEDVQAIMPQIKQMAATVKVP